MEIAIDSGAGESVAPPGMPGTSKIRASKGMKEGVTYAAAAGKLIRNEGEFDLCGMTDEWRNAKWTFQVADITKPLGALKDVLAMGNRVEFDEVTGHWIVNKRTGTRTQMKKKNGVFVLNMWVRDDGRGGIQLGAVDEQEEDKQGFQRQANKLV